MIIILNTLNLPSFKSSIDTGYKLKPKGLLTTSTTFSPNDDWVCRIVPARFELHNHIFTFSIDCKKGVWVLLELTVFFHFVCGLSSFKFLCQVMQFQRYFDFSESKLTVSNISTLCTLPIHLELQVHKIHY